MTRRVVITGVGTITALGHTAGETWGRLLEGTSGVARITHFDATDMPCQIAAEVRDFDPTTVVEEREVKKIDPFSMFGLSAGAQAMRDAALEQGAYDGDRFGCIMGVGIGGLTDIEATKELLVE